MSYLLATVRHSRKVVKRAKLTLTQAMELLDNDATKTMSMRANLKAGNTYKFKRKGLSGQTYGITFEPLSGQTEKY